MKKIYSILAILFVVNTSTLTAQNSFWTFPDQFWRPGLGVANLLSSNDSYFVHAGIQDPYKRLMFYTIDDQVYSKDGLVNGVLQVIDPGNIVNAEGYSESLIVPQPGSCDRYYIFQAGNKDVLNERNMLPYYGIYDYSLGSLEHIGPGGGETAIRMDYVYWNDWYTTNNRTANVHFAATKERPDNSRWIFVSNNQSIYRVALDCDSLYGNSWSYQFGFDEPDYGNRSELELYEDTANNVIRIAVPYEEHDSNGWIKVAIFDLDSVTGNYVTGSRKTINLPNGVTPGGPIQTYVHGLEFTPDGKGLYISHEINSNFSSPLSFYEIATQTLTNLNYSGIGSFLYSQLQISGDSANYSLHLVRLNNIAALKNPDNPLPLDPLSWNPTSRNLNNYAINNGGFSNFSIGDRKRLIPDQIDYEDYAETMIKASCDCCEKYAYAGQNKDTIFEVSNTQTWSYGLGDNPWNAVSGDTIFIRDYLKIKPGVTVTIDNMIFKFGPDARVIVERGGGGSGGARLHLKNRSIFTADFRCSKNKYTCPDPNKGCDTLKVWQGVRVEGLASDHSQSAGNQATFTMSSGSMIEYAKTGIRVGHEALSNFGGGIITIKDSYLKDNITGIQFDEYMRISNGTEMYNKSKVERTSFTSTEDWLPSYLPNAHVVINASSGITLHGNEYANYNTGFNNTQRGTGVKISNSRVEIKYACSNSTGPCSLVNPVRSEFNNLYFGIYGLNDQTATRTLYCYYNEFKNTYYGAFLSGFTNAMVLDNDFNVQAAHFAAGLQLIGSTGYYVQNNNFTTPGSQMYWNTGLIVSNSGPYENEIYRNTFSKLNIAGLVDKENMDPGDHDIGLHWVCNEFIAPITKADIYLNGDMSDNQGLCNGGVPAGNLFSWSSQLGGAYNNHFDLQATSISTTNIVYSHHNMNGSPPPNLVPLVWNSGHYQISECTQSNQIYTSKSCPIEKSGAPPVVILPPGLMSNTPSFESVSAQATDYLEQMTALNANASETATATEEFKQIRRENDKFWHEISSFYMADTTGAITRDEMELLITTFEPTNVQRFASVLLPSTNQDWIGETNGFNASAMSEAVLPAMVGGELPSDIPEWFESDFFSSPSNVAALNSLYIENDAIYNPYFPLPELSSSDEGKSNKADKDLVDENTKNKLVVHPNPFKTYTTFDLSAYQFEGDNNRIVFYDLLGKKVFESPIAEKQVNLTVQGADLPTGVVIYKLFVNDTTVETGKIISVK